MVVNTIEKSNDLNALSIDELHEKLLVHEEMIEEWMKRY